MNDQLLQDLLTVDDLEINPANDVEWDDLTVFTNNTCKEALKKILLASNSVLYMSETTPIVSGRIASADVLYEFFGPGSVAGPENICDIKDIRNGLNRTFNFVRWKDSDLVSQDDTSIARQGTKIKDVSIDGITTSLTKSSVIDAIRVEFGTQKQEFKLVAPLTYDLLALPLLARVSIDFPIVMIEAGSLALYGVAEYGVANYPAEVSTFEILSTDHYKVIGVEINPGKHVSTLRLRRI